MRLKRPKKNQEFSNLGVNENSMDGAQEITFL
jgi:hypothetical protein